ncbi:MAG: ion transporter [Candidatus Methylumidiphilus sp.]
MHDRIGSLRHALYSVIFQSHSRAGRGFDIGLIFCILASSTVVILDSVGEINQRHGNQLLFAERIFTAIFTLEYSLRIFCIHRPFKYIFSFYGVIDLLAILPSYVSLLIPGTHYLQIIRILRVLRIFRILKLIQFINQSNLLLNALVASRIKIFIFLFTISTLLIVFGSAMYLIEGPENGFSNIPVSIYWAVVTLTTVGFGDITPKTDLGRAVSALVMIIGYAIIAVPTGIFTAELNQEMRRQDNQRTARVCGECGKRGHDDEANFCMVCGKPLSSQM